MAEPILGQALALQSEFRPDTTPLLTRAADKLGDINLKKTIAKQKAEEAKQKELQNLYSAIKLDTPKISQHFIPEARDLYAKSLMGMMEAANKGDRFEVERLKGEANMLLNNIAMQSEASAKFLESEKQGFIVPQEVKVAFAMPKQQGQEYLKDLFNKKPELRGLVDINEYGDYTFNNVKNLNVEDDLVETISKNERLLAPTGKKVVNYRTKDEEEIYRIPDDKIQEFSIIKSQDPELRANILLKDREKLEEYTQKAQAAKPSMTAEEAAEVGLQNYLFDKLQKVNEKRIKSNIPQKGGGFNFAFGGGKELDFDNNDIPRGGSLPLKLSGVKDGRKLDFEGQVATGNPYGFKMVTIGGTNSDGVIDIKNNSQLGGKTFQKVEAFEAVSVPVATKDFTTSRGIKYKKGQMIDRNSVNVAVKDGFAQYQPMIKGIATYKEKDNYGGGDKMVTSDVLIPASRISTAVVSAQGKGDDETTYNYIQTAKKEADELNRRYRKSQSNTVTSQPRKQEVKKFNTSIKFN